MAPTSLTKDLKRKRSAKDEDEEMKAGAKIGGANRTSTKAPYKQRVLVLSSRGINQRQRHLMNDLAGLLPHSKRDAKLDSKHQLPLLNELCDLSNCNNALFFEARRKHQDLYLWMAKAPNGPSIRFHAQNIHTMEEMKMTGNCLKGSRPIVVFDKAFDASSHLRLIKEVMMHIFAVPKTARRAKPFIDHIINFSIADGKIWFRNYQILDAPSDEIVLPEGSTSTSSTTTAVTDTKPKKGKKGDNNLKRSLSEIGPRFVLTPVKIFEGSFNGATLYENEEFVPSGQVSAAQKTARAGKYKARKGQQEERKVRLEEIQDQKLPNQLEVRSVFA